MLTSHKLDLERSEKRERLNEIAVMEGELTTEIRAEVKKISAEVNDIETKYRAALLAESTESDKPEEREAKDLEDNLRLRAYMNAAMTGAPLDSREREYNSEHGLADNVVPLAAVAPRVRVDVASPSPTTGNPVNQASIVERVFANSVAPYLGVSMPSVAVGEASYPVVTGGTTAEMKAVDEAKESTAMTIAVKSVKPTRLTARYTFRREDVATTEGIENALRSDLSNTMSDALDSQILTGNGTSPNVSGFFATAANGGLAAASGNFAPSGIIDYAKWATLVASAVDGKFANGLKDLRILVGTAAYGKLASVFQSNTADSPLSFSNRETGGVRASAKTPAVASNKQRGIIVRGNRTGEAVAPVWEGLTLIRDELSDAGKGWIHVTAVMLWNFVRIRDDSYQQINPQVTS